MSRVLWARGWGAVALIGAVAVGLSGCSPERGTEPPPSPSVSGSSSSSSSSSGSGSASGSASPTPSASIEVPEAARAHTTEGGIEFAKFAVMQASRALQSNDAAIFDQLTLDSCSGCGAVAEGVEAQKSAGETVQIARAEISGAQLFAPETDRGLEVDVIGVERATDVRDSAGKVVRSLPEAPLRMRVAVSWTDGRWWVAQMAAVKI